MRICDERDHEMEDEEGEKRKTEKERQKERERGRQSARKKIEGNRARGSTYFVVVVQSYPLERDDFVCLAILGFEHGAISACNEK